MEQALLAAPPDFAMVKHQQSVIITDLFACYR